MEGTIIYQSPSPYVGASCSRFSIFNLMAMHLNRREQGSTSRSEAAYSVRAGVRTLKGEGRRTKYEADLFKQRIVVSFCSLCNAGVLSRCLLID